MDKLIVFGSVFIIILASFLIIFLIYKSVLSRETIYEYQRGLKYDKGKFEGVLEPGQYYVFRASTYIQKLDIRPSFLTVQGQEVLTLDGASVKINLVAKYEIEDPVLLVNSNANYIESLYIALQLSLRDSVSLVKVEELIENRSQISNQLLESSIDKVKEMGIKLHSAELKDVTLPGDLKKAFGDVLKAQREGMAKLEKARGETAALRNLANAAKMIENNPYIMQLRILQTLEESTGNTVVLNMTDDNKVITKINND